MFPRIDSERQAITRFLAKRWMVWLVSMVVIIACGVAAAAPQEESISNAGNLNLKMPTLGGKQFWTDHVWVQDWRIQQHALTGHWRLLNPKNVRYAWGSREACDEALKQQGIRHDILGGQVIILLHGLMRSASSMQGLREHLSSKLEASIVSFEYASTRGSMSSHAAALRELVAGLPTDVQLKFVGHSMGNIVLRHAIADWQTNGETQTLERLKSVVMLGPPNQGAAIARQLSRTGVFGWVAGTGGLELGPEWESLQSKLAVPPCPFGIVAGRLPESSFSNNPLIEGSSDLVVSVEETRLAGQSDSLEVPQLHSFLMDDPVVQQAVVRFLEHGSFKAPDAVDRSAEPTDCSDSLR